MRSRKRAASNFPLSRNRRRLCMLNSQRTPYMLTERHFAITIAVALLLHMSGFVAWSLSPKQIVRDIPIRTLNIRLGESDEMELEKPSAPTGNLPQVEAIIEKLGQDIQAKPTSKPEEG